MGAIYHLARILGIREVGEDTELIVKIKECKLSVLFRRKEIRNAEIRFDDGRMISAEQRKKIYATLRDICDWNGDILEVMKGWLKVEHMVRTGSDYISLSDCSMDTAREFINTILDFALEHGIPLSEIALERTDDIGHYLYSCIKHKKCAVCGIEGEVHHVDVIGMGRNRKHYDDSDHKKICLCRIHHEIAHNKGKDSFFRDYKVYGIIFNEVEDEDNADRLFPKMESSSIY